MTHFPQRPTCTCGHVDTRTHQLTPSLSHGLYLSRVLTRRALAGPALRGARPYIYPTLLLRVTNMGTHCRGGGPPSYLPTMWSGPYIVMIVSVTVALTSTYSLTSAQSPQWPRPKDDPPDTGWLGRLSLSLSLSRSSFAAFPSFTYFVKSDLVELVALCHFPACCIPPVCAVFVIKSASLILICCCCDIYFSSLSAYRAVLSWYVLTDGFVLLTVFDGACTYSCST